MIGTYRKDFVLLSAKRELFVPLAFSFVLLGCTSDGVPIGGSGDAGGSAATSSSGSNATSNNATSSAVSASTVSPSGTMDPITSKPVVDAGDDDAGNEAGAATNDCGGALQVCCARFSCEEGLVCVDEPSANDGGSVAFDAGRNNHVSDAGGADTRAANLPVDAAAVADAAPPVATSGICAPCGAEDERCCAENACDQGLSCQGSGFGANAAQRCEPAASVDAAGINEDGGVANEDVDAATNECGGVDQACCPSRGRQCDRGLQCDRRPPAGREGDVCIED